MKGKVTKHDVLFTTRIPTLLRLSNFLYSKNMATKWCDLFPNETIIVIADKSALFLFISVV